MLNNSEEIIEYTIYLPIKDSNTQGIIEDLKNFNIRTRLLQLTGTFYTLYVTTNNKSITKWSSLNPSYIIKKTETIIVESN
jgi:hypothetical protein